MDGRYSCLKGTKSEKPSEVKPAYATCDFRIKVNTKVTTILFSQNIWAGID